MGAQNLSGCTLQFVALQRNVDIEADVRIIGGATSGGQPVALLLDTTGAIVLSGTAGGGNVVITGPKGRQADALSVSVALSTEDIAALTPTGSTSPSNFKNVGANATLNVKASAGKVFSLYCHNSNAASRYVQLFNTATVPATGVTVPDFCFLVPPGNQTVIGTDFFTNAGCAFATGIAFAFSTTRDVYTAGSAGDQQTSIQFS